MDRGEASAQILKDPNSPKLSSYFSSIKSPVTMK